jgi:hypothetical protein
MAERGFGMLQEFSDDNDLINLFFIRLKTFLCL